MDLVTALLLQAGSGIWSYGNL